MNGKRYTLSHIVVLKMLYSGAKFLNKILFKDRILNIKLKYVASSGFELQTSQHTSNGNTKDKRYFRIDR